MELILTCLQKTFLIIYCLQGESSEDEQDEDRVVEVDDSSDDDQDMDDDEGNGTEVKVNGIDGSSSEEEMDNE